MQLQTVSVSWPVSHELQSDVTLSCPCLAAGSVQTMASCSEFTGLMPGLSLSRFY